MGIGKKKGWFRKHGGGGFDADAQAFITAAGITDSTQQTAINTLVVGLKADSLWSKMKAIYPFVGGTADTHKYNLKDPRDLDAAFRITWNGSLTHSSNGVLPDGGTGTYGDTHIAVTTDLSEDSTHLNYYSRTDDSNTAVEIGTLDGNIDFYLALNYGSFDFVTNINNTGLQSLSTATSIGMFTASRSDASNVRKFKNGAFQQNFSASSDAYTATDVTLFRNKTNETTVTQCAFASIGDGLTDTNVSDLYTRVQAYQTTLNRQV